MMLRWFRGRRQAERLAKADAAALSATMAARPIARLAGASVT
jgi:hypothetical protein